MSPFRHVLMLDAITFGLAFLAYLLVCVGVILYVWGQGSRAVAVLAAVVACAHVGMVWGHRFDWSPAAAWEKGIAGFVVFHLALTGIVAAALARQPYAGRCVAATFPIVTAGALGAVFRYEVVEMYRLPLLAAAGLTVALAAIGWGKSRGSF